MGHRNGGVKNKGNGDAVKWLRARESFDKDYCLIWPFSSNPETGYGHFGYMGRMLYAHRFMCEEAHGAAPEGKTQVAHLCGNGHAGCVNPRHLAWKSISENLMDRREHGTVRANPNGHAGKLSEEQIAQIRALKGVKSQYEIARMFGVGRPAIQYWHKHDKPHSPPQLGTSRNNLWKRRRKAEAAKKTVMFID